MFENGDFMPTFWVPLVFICYPTDTVFWHHIAEYNAKFVSCQIFDTSVLKKNQKNPRSVTFAFLVA